MIFIKNLYIPPYIRNIEIDNIFTLFYTKYIQFNDEL